MTSEQQVDKLRKTDYPNRRKFVITAMVVAVAGCGLICVFTGLKRSALGEQGSTQAPPIEYWIQLENQPWDMSPRGINRMGAGINAQGRGTAEMTLTRPVGPPYTVTGFNVDLLSNDPKNVPVDLLILRRYKPPTKANPAWTVPDDRKVNPWDLNERDPRSLDEAGKPTIMGTSGTIPGATIECNVGDSVVIHFRNMDRRMKDDTNKDITNDKDGQRVHSLHTHGFVFAQEFDGAYPLSKLDLKQPITTKDEEKIWSVVPGGLDQFRNPADKKQLFKRGDRVPPGGTFDYTWKTIAWPTTAGVWIYHDHSIHDTDNVRLGAIGFVVIHNPNDPNDVPIIQPGSTDLPGGSFVGKLTTDDPEPPKKDPSGQEVIQPPAQAQYLLLFHELGKTGAVCINGRLFLGNTPTIIAGLKTKMRFGVAAMGQGEQSASGFHTFHIHGHRWVIPGPDGNKNAGGGGVGDPNSIQNSALVRSVSQFEDTKILGPANSFSFTIVEDSGLNSFMRAEPALGEWHMHCHVLDHMVSGMMGSLLVVEKGQILDLPQAPPNPTMTQMRLKVFERMRMR